MKIPPSRTRGRRATVLFVEDTAALIEEFPVPLRRDGHVVITASRAGEALKAIRESTHIDVAVIDLHVPTNDAPEIGADESGGGRYAGIVIARELRKKFKRVPIIFWTTKFDRDIRDMVTDLRNAHLISKAAGTKPVLEMLHDSLDGFRSGNRPRTFIVHGHDNPTMSALREFLEEKLHFPPPIVLREAITSGRTVIEKLESYAYAVDIVFVLMTPDDRVNPVKSPREHFLQPRQNVIFELGFFIGILGRTSGKIILLYRKPIQAPSDISGMVAIDIGNGFDAVSDEIRQELRDWL